GGAGGGGPEGSPSPAVAFQPKPGIPEVRIAAVSYGVPPSQSMLPSLPSAISFRQRQVLSRMAIDSVTSSFSARHATPLVSGVPMTIVSGPGGIMAAALALSALLNRPLLDVPSSSLVTSLGMPSCTPGSMLNTRVAPPVQPPGGVQPFNALFTAVLNSLMPTMPSPFASSDAHWLSCAVPKAMFTPMISSLIATMPSSLQSPTQVCAPAEVAATIKPNAAAHIIEVAVFI